MIKGFDGFNNLENINTNTDYSKPSTTAADVVDGEEVIKRLYAVTQSTIDTIEHYSSEDGQGYGDVVRAAIYLLKNSTAKKRAAAYAATKTIKRKTGPKKS